MHWLTVECADMEELTAELQKDAAEEGACVNFYLQEDQEEGAPRAPGEAQKLAQAVRGCAREPGATLTLESVSFGREWPVVFEALAASPRFIGWSLANNVLRGDAGLILARCFREAPWVARLDVRGCGLGPADLEQIARAGLMREKLEQLAVVYDAEGASLPGPLAEALAAIRARFPGVSFGGRGPGEEWTAEHREEPVAGAQLGAGSGLGNHEPGGPCVDVAWPARQDAARRGASVSYQDRFQHEQGLVWRSCPTSGGRRPTLDSTTVTTCASDADVNEAKADSAAPFDELPQAGGEDEEEGGEADSPPRKAKQRHCKGKRDRYRKLVTRMSLDVSDLNNIDWDTLCVPPSIMASEAEKDKLLDRVRALQASQRQADRAAAGCPCSRLGQALTSSCGHVVERAC